MKKLLVLLAIIMMIAGCSNTTTDKLVVLTSSGYYPYEMVDTDGNLIGFDIEFGEALAEIMGVEIVWEDMDFDGIIASLNSNRGDMAIAAMSPDPSRNALFSDSYYVGEEESPFFVLTLKTSGIVDADSIANKTVGVQIGTIQEQMINQLQEEFSLTIDPRNSVTQMVLEVTSGRLDFIVIEGPTAKEYVNQFDTLTTFELSNDLIESYLIEVNGVSVALPVDSELLEQVNAAIATLKENGTLAALVAKWFNQE
jgi:arginine/lysine/histidine transporter system substrate-binding protein